MNHNFPGGYQKVDNKKWTTYFGKEVDILEKEIVRLHSNYSEVIVTTRRIKGTLAYVIDIEFENEADEAEFIMRESL